MLPYIKIYTDFIDIVRELDNGARGRLFLAILQYANGEETTDLTGGEKIAFLTIKGQINRDRDTYASISEKRSTAGQNGAKKRWESKEKVANAILPLANDSKNSTCQQDKDKNKDKDNDKDEELKTSSNEDVCPAAAGRGNDEAVIKAWNSLNLNPVRGVLPGSRRRQLLNGRLNQNGLPAILEAIENVRISPFLNGQNKSGFSATFDWFLKPSNFQKVLDGNYGVRRVQPEQANSTADRLAQMIQEGVFDD